MRAFSLRTPLGELAALSNDRKGPRVLALHGWLDNAASFLPLAPHLGDVELVAIDLPGHGHSAHLGAGGDYSFAGSIASVLDAADALGWDRFRLLGHSMGGAIASLVACACPERIERLATIEALGVLTEAPERTGARLHEAVAAQRALKGKHLRVFPDIDSAVQARFAALRAPGAGLEPELLRLLVERGVRSVDGGFVWSSDPRLTLPTLVRMTQAQADDLLAGIECPTLVLFADPPQPYLPDAERRRRVAALPKGRMEVLAGGHHLHMQQPARVAAVIAPFLRQQ